MDGAALPLPATCISRRLRWCYILFKYAILCCICMYLKELDNLSRNSSTSHFPVYWKVKFMANTDHLCLQLKSEINDMELGPYRSRSGCSVDTVKSSNGTRTVDFYLVWTRTRLANSTQQYARVWFATRTGLDTALELALFIHAFCSSRLVSCETHRIICDGTFEFWS